MTIDIGNEAAYAQYQYGAGIDTVINRANPANVTGVISQVEIWVALPITENLYIASFQKVGTNKFSTRDYEIVGTVGASTVVTSCEINNGGTGYQVDDVIHIEQVAGHGSGAYDVAELKVLTIDGGGAITGIELLSGGVLYHVENDVSIDGGSGANATVNILTVIGKKIIETNIDVIVGDYIGFDIPIPANDGGIAFGITGGEGIWSIGEWVIPCTNETFVLNSEYKVMIGGEITEEEGGAVTPDEDEEIPRPENWHHDGITTMNCFVAVNEQASNQKTYAEIDGTLLVNQTGEFYGKTIDCELNVIRDVVNACLGDVIPATITGSDVAFVDGGAGEDTITQVSAGFITAGLVVGDIIIISGSDSNDGTYTILSISAGAINVVTGSLTTEGIGASINITAGYPVGGIEQNIRLGITIDGEDVIDSLIGNMTIAHNKNYISTFSFQLGDPKYSPLTDSHIAVDSEVIIIVYINGQEIKLFTGLIDSTNTDFDGGYRLTIKGRGYGKKLLEKTMTLISIEQSAKRKYRGSVIEFIAEQGDITNVDIPIGDAIGIDHSFQDQSPWDMIQKECAIEGWYVRFDENAKMILKTTSKKTTADWEYGEDKFEELGLETTDRGIINKVTILGAEWEEEIIKIEVEDIEQEIEVPTSEYQEDTLTISKSFSLGERVEDYSYEDANFKVTTKYLGHTKPSGYIFPKYQDYKFTVAKLNSDYTTMDVSFVITGGASKYWEGKVACNIHREIQSTLDWVFTQKAFDISIVIKFKEEVSGGSTWITENIPNETTTSTIVRHQVKATVTDEPSIVLYGERKPNNEGTLHFPLAETETQCKRIGENVIIESHRFIKQPDYLVAFNPKLIVGCTVKITSASIGYDEEWVVEEVVHMINIAKKTGEIKARTRIGCVYYA